MNATSVPNAHVPHAINTRLVLHDSINLLCDEETREPKCDQARGNRPEPVQIINLLTCSWVSQNTMDAIEVDEPGTRTFIPHMPVMIFIGRTVISQ